MADDELYAAFLARPTSSRVSIERA